MRDSERKELIGSLCNSLNKNCDCNNIGGSFGNYRSLGSIIILLNQNLIKYHWSTEYWRWLANLAGAVSGSGKKTSV